MKEQLLPHLTLPSIAGLERYQGPWDESTVAHLLRRTTYGPTQSEIAQGVTLGLDGLVDLLFSDLPDPEEPINFYYEDDPDVAIGESWIDKTYDRGPNQAQIRNARLTSLTAWTGLNLLNAGLNIREKMILFWHNHFVVQASVIRDANFLYHHFRIFRNLSLGNFRTLVEQITISPAMLRYLNGNQNTAEAPNENYARELLELFTVGKGEQVGSGDYTTFTEQDVFEAAKVLTGWVDRGYFGNNGNAHEARFFSGRHDNTSKQFSNRLGNAVIAGNGDEEYKDLIGVLLDQDAVATFICRKLYRWFVYYDITPEIESNIIEPLAEIFRNNDYEIQPVLETLLKSAHFHEICSVGPMIKNPIDFIFNLMRQFEVDFPEETIPSYLLVTAIFRGLEGFDMGYYEPPNVAGWKAYYQEPLFYRTWITAATLPIRQNFTNIMARGNIVIGDYLFGINALDYVSRFDNPSDPNVLIANLVDVHLPQPLTEGQLNYLKEILIPGLPDFEWTVEYNTHLANPDDEELKRSVENKLVNLLTAFLSLPEYNLS